MKALDDDGREELFKEPMPRHERVRREDEHLRRLFGLPGQVLSRGLAIGRAAAAEVLPALEQVSSPFQEPEVRSLRRPGCWRH